MDRKAESDRDGDCRVAVVHHNALIREGLCRILDAGGFHVVWQAADGAQILECPAGCRPELVLLEWDAPGVGASLVRALASSSCGAAVVLLSRPDIRDHLGPVMEAGAAGCLSVNMDAGDFLSSLHLLAEGDLVVSHDMVPVVTGEGGAEDPQCRLTPREIEIMRFLGRGATNNEIAEELRLSPHTVKIHVHQVLVKLELRNRAQVAAYAVAKGIL